MNQKGIDLIKKYEGLSLVAYPDPATKGAPWTIGYGHTGKDVNPTSKITKEQAETLLDQDVQKIAKIVDNVITAKITDDQFSALISLAFNIGPYNFVKSTLVSTLNTNDFVGTAKEILRWNKADGKVMAGLVKRRNDEKTLFMSVFK